jgi:hypothetical protein
MFSVTRKWIKILPKFRKKVTKKPKYLHQSLI